MDPVATLQVEAYLPQLASAGLTIVIAGRSLAQQARIAEVVVLDTPTGPGSATVIAAGTEELFEQLPQTDRQIVEQPN
jgi:ABC-type phosphate transport system ATPase subunit